MPPKKLRPSNWRSLEDGGTAVVFDEAVLLDVGGDVGMLVVVVFIGTVVLGATVVITVVGVTVVVEIMVVGIVALVVGVIVEVIVEFGVVLEVTVVITIVLLDSGTAVVIFSVWLLWFEDSVAEVIPFCVVSCTASTSGTHSNAQIK